MPNAPFGSAPLPHNAFALEGSANFNNPVTRPAKARSSIVFDRKGRKHSGLVRHGVSSLLPSKSNSLNANHDDPHHQVKKKSSSTHNKHSHRSPSGAVDVDDHHLDYDDDISGEENLLEYGDVDGDGGFDDLFFSVRGGGGNDVTLQGKDNAGVVSSLHPGLLSTSPDRSLQVNKSSENLVPIGHDASVFDTNSVHIIEVSTHEPNEDPLSTSLGSGLRNEVRQAHREMQLNAMRQYREQQRQQKQATVFNESSIADPNPHLWLFEHRTDERPKRKVFRGATDLSDYINGLFEFQEVQREAKRDEKEADKERRQVERRMRTANRPTRVVETMNATSPDDPISSSEDILTRKVLAQHQQQHVAFETNVPSIIANHHDPVFKAAIAAIPSVASKPDDQEASFLTKAQRQQTQVPVKQKKRRNMIPMSDGGIISSSSSSSSGTSSSSSTRSSSSRSHRRAKSRARSHGRSSRRTPESRSSSTSSATSSSTSSSSSTDSDDSVEQCFWLDIQDTDIDRIAEIVKTFDHAGDAIVSRLRSKWAEDFQDAKLPSSEKINTTIIVEEEGDYNVDTNIGMVAAANASLNATRKKKNTKLTTDFLEAERASRFVYVKIQHQKLDRDDETMKEEEARRAERLEAKRRRNEEVKLRRQTTSPSSHQSPVVVNPNGHNGHTHRQRGAVTQLPVADEIPSHLTEAIPKVTANDELMSNLKMKEGSEKRGNSSFRSVSNGDDTHKADITKVLSLNEIRVLMGLRPYYHIHVLCFKQWIITIHSDPVDGMAELVRRIHGAFGFTKRRRQNNRSGNFKTGSAQTLTMVDSEVMTTGWVMASLIEFVIQSYLPDPRAIYADIGATEELVTELATNDTNLFDEHKAMLKRIGFQMRSLSENRQLLLDKEKLLRQLLSPLIRLTFISKYRMIADQYDYMLEQVYHHVQHIDTAKEMLSQINGNFASALSIYMTSIADRKNDRLAVLSRVASICLPLNLVAGLMGMNCRVPFQSDKVDEVPWAFITIILIMISFFLTAAQPAKLWKWSDFVPSIEADNSQGEDFTEGRKGKKISVLKRRKVAQDT